VNQALGAFGIGGSQGDTRPGAYLNYILFDKSYKLLDMGWTAVPTTALNTKQQISIPTVNIKQAGYIFVYLSYENVSNNYVEFDDFKVTYTKSNVLQYNEYYPFGLQTSNSWTRENASNRYLYNGGNELNENSGWYETFFRGYDAALGRFMQIDPLASLFSSSSPYNYANNNPILLNDMMGSSADTANYSGSGGSHYNSHNFPHPYNGHTFIGPGSGNHWSDGAMQYSDWSANGGSDDFRRAQAMGAEMRGSFQYLPNQKGQLEPFSDRNGTLGVWEVEINRLVDPLGLSSDGYSYNTEMVFKEREAGPGTDPYDGHSISIVGNVALGSGLNVGVGVVWNNAGDWRFFGSWGPSFGLDASLGVAIKGIANVNSAKPFDPNQYAGWGSSNNVGIGVMDFVVNGGDNYPNFSTGTMGATYNESGGGVSDGPLPFAYTYQTSYTFFPGDW
jgi:RHS repeat-associated protein